MKTELRGCDSIFDLSCPCKMFVESNLFIEKSGTCECGHGISDHTYDVTKPEMRGGE